LFTESNIPIWQVDEQQQHWAGPLPEPMELDEGTYWLSVQAEVLPGFEMLIKESSTHNGAPYVWKNPGGGFGTSCSDWTPGMNCLGQQPSLAFRIYGTSEQN
jgi:hypothetical protein